MIGSGIFKDPIGAAPLVLQEISLLGVAVSGVLVNHDALEVPEDDRDLTHNLNVAIVQGNTLNLAFAVFDVQGDPILASDVQSVKWVLRKYDESDPVLTRELEDGVVIAEEDNLKFVVSLSVEETEDLVGNYLHEAILGLVDGSVCTVVADSRLRPGIFAVRKRVA